MRFSKSDELPGAAHSWFTDYALSSEVLKGLTLDN